MAKTFRFDPDDDGFVSRKDVRAARKAEKLAKRQKQRDDERMDGTADSFSEMAKMREWS